jgi:hypothetical protein
VREGEDAEHLQKNGSGASKAGTNVSRILGPIMIVRLDEELKLARRWTQKSRFGEIKWESRLI